MWYVVFSPCVVVVWMCSVVNAGDGSFEHDCCSFADAGHIASLPGSKYVAPHVGNIPQQVHPPPYQIQFLPAGAIQQPQPLAYGGGMPVEGECCPPLPAFPHAPSPDPLSISRPPNPVPDVISSLTNFTHAVRSHSPVCCCQLEYLWLHCFAIIHHTSVFQIKRQTKPVCLVMPNACLNLLVC